MGSESTEVGRTGARFGSARVRGASDGKADGAHRRRERKTEEPAAPDTDVGLTGARFGSHSARRPADEVEEPAGPDTGVGLTGARFGPHSTRPSGGEVEEPAGADTGVGLTGARFGPHSTRRREKPAEPLAEFLPVYQEMRPVARFEPSAEPLPLESEVLIRPYARTGGRTRPDRDLAIEALITTNPDMSRFVGRHRSWEQRMIANLCVRPHSVAEVAALLSIPLGVARILLVDMAGDGTVVVHGGSGNRGPDVILMRRVLAGLRRL
jgi:Protein of unknown function (DUF742)